MNKLISKLLQKRGIDDLEHLTDEEKVEFDRWSEILSEGDITVDKMKGFCQSQLGLIEDQYINPDNSEKKDVYLKASLSVYKSIIKLIESPKVGREALVKYLEQLINN